MPPKAHKPPRRTLELPAKLREELQALGQIPKPGKGKLGRKDRRKQQRNDSKANRAAHFAGKRKAEDNDEPPAPAPKAAKAGAGKAKEAKRRKVEVESEEEAVAAPVKKAKTTALERMLAKQEGGGVDVGRKKSKVEGYEDDEIAWLEAKLGVRGPATKAEKGKWKDEFMDDGLEDLFEGIDNLEDAAFGGEDKDYTKLLEAGTDDDLTDASDDDHLHGSGDEDDESDSAADYGLSDDELIDPSDDDDHREVGEIGSEEESEGDEGAIDMSDLEGEEDDSEIDSDEADNHEADEEEDVEQSRVKRATVASSGEKGAAAAQDEAATAAPIASTSAPTDAPAVKGRYVPPHLRAAAAAAEAAAAATPAPSAPHKDAPPPIDPRLRRQIMGHLNKLSSLNMAAILAALDSIYAAHPRAVVTATLTTLLLEIIATRDNLGEQLIINYACLVAALSRTVGIELPAGVVAKSVEMYDQAREKAGQPVEGEAEGEGFEGRPGSKEAENLVAFLAEMYNFQVIGCVLVYDVIKNLIQSGLNELEVELLVKLVKRSGQQLRTDDPSALKEIINLVKQAMQGVDPKTMNSRTRFMVDALTNLKNNKIKPDANGAVDHYSPLKKFLSSLAKRGRSTPEPLRLTLADLRSSEAKGKWWLVGAAWSGDPLAEGSKLEFAKKESTGDKQMAKLAKAQGMNTDIRKGVFTVLMTSEDYVDACERLLQLGLTDVQQREIARVLLQCAGNEKAYNPYYTLVASRMAGRSHGFAITLQYCLWDFLREMGESKVGGEEMVRNLQEEGRSGGRGKVSERRAGNIAKLYAWCVAKDVLSLAILKPVPFARLQPQTVAFFRAFFSALFLSSQTASPALVLLSSTTTKRDQAAVEKVFVKALPFAGLVRGLSKFVEEDLEGVESGVGEKEAKLVRFGGKVAGATLGVGGMELGERF